MSDKIAVPVTVEKDTIQGKVFLSNDNGQWLADVHSRKARAMAQMLNEHALLVAVAEAAKEAQCDCTPRERVSGHKSGCWMVALNDALGALNKSRKAGGE